MSPPAPPRATSCQACGQAVVQPDEAGFHCECGVLGGEGVRCRTCGHLT
jgi:hypothetical protein